MSTIPTAPFARLSLLAFLSLLPVAAHAAIIEALPASTGYNTGSDAYANNNNSGHDSIQTFTINSTTPTSTTRALTVAANTEMNGGTFAQIGGYSGTMPALFGGFTASASGSNIATSLTVRTQYQNGGVANDFVNIRTYHEGSAGIAPIAAGLTFRLAGAYVFSTGGVQELGQLGSMTYVGGGTSYVAGTIATHRVVVRDASSGDFYVSSASLGTASGTIDLSGSQWAALSTSNLTSVSAYAAPGFTQFDYIGLYSDNSVTTTADQARYTVLNNFTLAALSYETASIPESSTVASLLGAVGLTAAVMLRRRRAT